MIGRWGSVDNLSELYLSNSSYTYALNNPTNAIDPNGGVVIFINGNHFGEGAIGYYSRYDYNSGNYNFYGSRDYWTNGKRNFDYEVMDQLNDHAKPIYRDGALGGYFGLFSSSVGLGRYNANNYNDRISAGFDQGISDAAAIVGNLEKNTQGEIIESIKIITHSMGGAYGKGYVNALKKYISTLPEKLQKQIKISLIADFDPYQAGSLTADPHIKTMQFIHKNAWNVIGLGGMANEEEKGNVEITQNSGTSTDHSIFTFFGDINSLEEGTYTWDGNQWVKK